MERSRVISTMNTTSQAQDDDETRGKRDEAMRHEDGAEALSYLRGPSFCHTISCSCHELSSMFLNENPEQKSTTESVCVCVCVRDAQVFSSHLIALTRTCVCVCWGERQTQASFKRGGLGLLSLQPTTQPKQILTRNLAQQMIKFE